MRLRLPYRVIFLLVGIGLLWNGPIIRAEMAGEYQVKAAFFYHFANFVDWPASTFTATQGNLRICIIGKDPFGPTLDETLTNKSIQNHYFEITRNPSSSQLPHCHMLYLPASASTQIRSLHKKVGNANVLTVGETRDFMKHGGMVQFFLDNQKVRFTINTDAVNQTQLKVSSKLLWLAEIYSP